MHSAPSQTQTATSKTLIGIDEAELWAMADALRGLMDAEKAVEAFA